MKKYMVIAKDEEGQTAAFFDDYYEAKNYFSAGMYGCGIYCELYAYTKPEEDAPEMYILIE